MVINNVEVKKGDCVIGCATCPGGYHYMLAFAFKAEDIVDGKVRCTFHDISFDDFVIRDYPESREIEDLQLPPAYDIYVVPEDAMNHFVSQTQHEELEENDVWNYFEEANKNAIAIIHKSLN